MTPEMAAPHPHPSHRRGHLALLWAIFVLYFLSPIPFGGLFELVVPDLTHEAAKAEALLSSLGPPDAALEDPAILRSHTRIEIIADDYPDQVRAEVGKTLSRTFILVLFLAASRAIHLAHAEASASDIKEAVAVCALLGILPLVIIYSILAIGPQLPGSLPSLDAFVDLQTAMERKVDYLGIVSGSQLWLGWFYMIGAIPGVATLWHEQGAPKTTQCLSETPQR